MVRNKLYHVKYLFSTGIEKVFQFDDVAVLETSHDLQLPVLQ